MKRLLTLFFFVFLFSACREAVKSPPDANDDLYSVINAYIEDADITGYAIAVIFEKLPALRLPADTGDRLWSPEIDKIDHFFFQLTKNSILSQEDIDSMLAQIPAADTSLNEPPVLMLDSARVSIHVMTEEERSRMFSSDDLFEYWKAYDSKYDGYSLRLSQPLFNANHSKVYFQAGKMRGYLSGYGEIVVMERAASGWKVIYRNETWVS